MTALPVTRREIGRLLSDNVTRIALFAILLVPLLYGAVYLWAFWDPYSHVDALPVALVVQDRPVELDGETIDAGRELADELGNKHTFKWREVSSDQAAAGLADGTYYMTLTIPADFSAKLATADGEHPSDARLIVARREGSNYLASQIGSRVFSEIRAAASASAARSYVDKMLVGFTDAQASLKDASLGSTDLAEGLAKAAEGADGLADGAGRARNGASELAAGSTALADGAARLDAGAVVVATGVRSLQIGLVSAASGSKSAAKGASSLAEGSASLSSGLKTAATGAGALSTGSGQLASSSAQLASGIGQLSVGSSKLAAGTGALSVGAKRLSAGVDEASAKVAGAASSSEQIAQAAAGLDGELSAFVSAHPEYADELEQAMKSSRAVKGGAAQLAGGLADAAKSAPQLSEGAANVAAGAAEVDAGAWSLSAGLSDAVAGSSKLAAGAGAIATGAASLEDGVSRASTGSESIASGATSLASGSASLASGLGAAASGSTRLAAGSRDLATGARALRAGTKDAAAGAEKLATGVSQIAVGARALSTGLEPAVEGSEELAGGLTAGASDMPSYTAASRARHASMMSDPVALDSTAIDPVPNYGTGFAPYFLPISLWVGSLVTFLFVAPLPEAHGGESPVRRALSGWFTASIVGVVQASLLVLVVVRALGLSAVHSQWVWTLALLAALVFAAIQQVLAASMGPAGKFLAIVLLVMQLTSASGTFPIEMQPAFFQAIHPLLPMTYVVSGLRVAISGGTAADFGGAMMMLLSFGAMALTATTLIALRGGSPLERRLSASIDI